MPPEPDCCVGTDGCLVAPQADKADGLPEDLLDAALAEQRQDWITGKRTPAARRLRQSPALASDPAQAAELVYHEFALRQELGEAPDWGDYLRQFPEQAEVLQLLHQADQIVEQALAPPEPAPRPAAQFSDYELLEEIGHGGMGVVFKARQRSLDRIVAVKMIRTGEYPGGEERKRFASEAKAVARLQHPNIVQIYEVGEPDGQPFFSLEFVEVRAWRAGSTAPLWLRGRPPG
jgi:eukaryotic-like serine/threonine-protein kinase